LCRRAEAGGGQSGPDEHEGVAVGVAEPEHRRDGVAHAADLGVDVDAALLELRVDAIDVVGVEADAGLDVASRVAGGRGDDGHGGVGPGRGDLHPAIAVAERHVGALLEAERLDIELDGALLVADRDADGPDLADTRRGLAHGFLLGGCG
jgi:hypothetical protein